MIDPAKEAARLAQAQAQASDQAKASMADPDAAFMAVMAVAPFELAEVLAEWSRRSVGMTSTDGPAESWCGGLGPNWHMACETPETYGRRMAAGIVKLLKEI